MQKFQNSPVLIIVALYMTLKQINFFPQFFTMQLWKVNPSPEMFQKIKQISQHNFLDSFSH